MTVIIRCADPRINKTFEKLASEQKNYATISNAGSIKFFLGEHLDDLIGQLNILSGKFDIDKIILTNHTDCGFYKSIGQAAMLNYIKDLKELQDKLKQIYNDKIEIICAIVHSDTGKLEYC